MSFDHWWEKDGQFCDPDTEDVPWFDKRKALAEQAYEAGVSAGLARGGNHVADDALFPRVITFANGRRVTLKRNETHGFAYYLEVDRT